MPKKVLPFPGKPPAQPDPLLTEHSRIIVNLGSSRYAIDITTAVTPLPAVPAILQVLPRKPKGITRWKTWDSHLMLSTGSEYWK